MFSKWIHIMNESRIKSAYSTGVIGLPSNSEGSNWVSAAMYEYERAPSIFEYEGGSTSICSSDDSS